MNEPIYLDVGGEIFKTTEETLLKSDFFRSYKKIHSKIIGRNDKPLFIDRDPKIFRHVLNLLRDNKYLFPEKYNHELKFWGIIEGEPVDFQYNKINFFTERDDNKEEEKLRDDITIGTFSEGITQKKVKRHFLQNFTESITFHRKLVQKSTFNLRHLQGKIFKILPVEYNFEEDGLITNNIFLLLPKSFKLKDLNDFTVKVEINDNYKNEYNLGISLHNFKKIESADGYYYVPLNIFDTSDNGLVGFIHKNKIKLTIESILDKNITCGIKYYYTNLGNLESELFKSKNITQLMIEPTNKKIVEGRCNLDKRLIKYMVWKTDKKVDYVILRNKNTTNEYILTRGDFQFMERHKLKLKKLPVKWGTIIFASNLEDLTVISGFLDNLDDEFELEFSESVNGILWQFSYALFQKRDNNELIVEYR